MSSPSKLGLSARDGEMFYHVIKSLGPGVKIDWNNVATAMGFKNRAVASTRFSQVMKKLEPPGKGDTDAPVAFSTPKAQKRKARDSQASGGNSSPSPCPKRAKKNSGRATALQDPVIKQERNDEAALGGNFDKDEGDHGIQFKVDDADKSDAEETVVDDVDDGNKAAT